MKERPIIFSGPMVRAILDGTKTQTRRVIKLQPLDILTHKPPWCNKSTRIHNGKRCWFYLESREPSRGGMFYCKHGEVGDRLWVKETWQETDESINEEPGVVYQATDPDWESMEGWKWRSSRFMPRWASRLTLEITDVRVQRVQGITLKDVAAEGVEPNNEQGWDCIDGYRMLWDSLNAKRGFNWDSNPWVWALTFKRLTND